MVYSLRLFFWYSFRASVFWYKLQYFLSHEEYLIFFRDIIVFSVFVCLKTIPPLCFINNFKELYHNAWEWWHKAGFSTLRRQRQEDPCEFKVSLNYIMRPSQKNTPLKRERMKERKEKTEKKHTKKEKKWERKENNHIVNILFIKLFTFMVCDKTPWNSHPQSCHRIAWFSWRCLLGFLCCSWFSGLSRFDIFVWWDSFLCSLFCFVFVACLVFSKLA